MVDPSDDLLADLCNEHESLSQETQKAECLRTSSDSEEDGDSGSTLWWVKLLHQHVPSRMPRKLRLRIISGCTGLCAEAAVLKVWVGVEILAGPPMHFLFLGPRLLLKI